MSVERVTGLSVGHIDYHFARVRNIKSERTGQIVVKIVRCTI